MATISIKDASGATTPVEAPLTPGRAAAAASRPVTLSTEDKAVLDAIDSDIGATTSPAAPADGTGDYSLLSAAKRGLLNGSLLLSRIPPPLTATLSQDAAGSPTRLIGQEVVNAGFSQVGASTLDGFFVQTPYVGSGVSYNQAAGALNIVAGTTVNAEFLARSTRAFRGSLRMRFSFVASQRIANNNFAVMLADLVGESLAYTIVSATQVNVTVPNHGWNVQMVGQFVNLGAITGGTDRIPGRYAVASIIDANTIQFTVAGWPASGTGTLTLFGRNYIRNLFTGTTATNVAFDTQRNGWAQGDTTANINTTASPGTVIANEITGRDVFISDALRASSTTPTFSTRGSRYENIPDSTTDLYVFLWNFNGSTAPASSTTWTTAHLSVENFANLPVYLQGFRAQGGANPIPVSYGTGQFQMVGGAAHDAVISGNPVRLAGRALTANYTAVASGDVADFVTNLIGHQVTLPYSIPESSWQGTGSKADTTDLQVKAAAAAGIRNYVTAVQIQNKGTVATDVVIKDGSTVLHTINCPASMTLPATITFPTPLRGTAATAVNIAALTTGANVLINAQGYIAP